MRIAICAAGEIWGGVERFLTTFTAGLRHADIPVVAILFHDGLLARELRVAGIAVEIVDQFRRYDPRQVLRVRRLLSAHAIDLVHVHGYRATIVGAAAARGLRIPVVKTEHGRFEPAASSVSALRMRANLWLDRAATRSVVRAIAFVSADMQRLAAPTVARTRTAVIYNGIGPRQARSTLERDGAFADSCFHIGMVGRLVPVKGHRHALEMMRRLEHVPDVRLHIFGSGPLEQACRRLSADWGVDGRVVFHGFRPHVVDCLKNLDLLLMPSLQEGLPYALLEAMRERLPVVASDLRSLREVFQGGEADGGMLVPPGDPDALAKAVELLYRDPARRERLSGAAYRRVTETFLADDMVDRYVALYATTLAEAS